MIDPRTVMVAIPTYSQRIVAEAVGSLIACTRFFGAISITGGVSHVSMARNIVAQKFLDSQFQWLVSLDDDIAFVPSDFQILMESIYGNDGNVHDAPTRVKCEQLAPPSPNEVGYAINYSQPTPGPHRIQGEADAIVCAEYSFKDDSLTPCRMGLGFTRIHRSVFERLAELKHEDGTARLWQSMHKGRLMTDFYPCGPMLSMIVPGSPWTGEDHGFFLMCKLAGIVPRIETRTRLFHVGSKAYPYHGGDAGGAQ